jgi:hypothetical protein
MGLRMLVPMNTGYGYVRNANIFLLMMKLDRMKDGGTHVNSIPVEKISDAKPILNLIFLRQRGQQNKSRKMKSWKEVSFS